MFSNRQLQTFVEIGGHIEKILVIGGTTFVSKYVADYFVNAGYKV